MHTKILELDILGDWGMYLGLAETELIFFFIKWAIAINLLGRR